MSFIWTLKCCIRQRSWRHHEEQGIVEDYSLIHSTQSRDGTEVDVKLQIPLPLPLMSEEG